MRLLNKPLGLETNVLRPKHCLVLIFVLTFLGSLVGLYFSWSIGLTGIAFSILAFKYVFRFGKELDLITVGELTQRIAREHYKYLRRNSATINHNEINRKVKEIFIADLDLEEAVLTREAAYR